MAKQSIGDRIVAAQHSLAGNEMSKAICKASTTELIAPKKKHVVYLLQLTNHSHTNIPDMVNCLVDRSKQLKWVIVFKSLITAHELMSNGNEKVMQHVASRSGLFRMEQFMDKSGGPSFDMSVCIKRYANYLNQKALSYRSMAYDFTRIERGQNGKLRSLTAENLLKTIPVLQQLIDSLLDFSVSPHWMTNPIINAAYMLLFKDLIRLFACYNDAMINLLDKFFTMKKSQCKEALDLYKKFAIRMDKVSEMLSVAEQAGISKSDIPDMSKAPNSILESLQQHYNTLEDTKSDRKHSSQSSPRRPGLQSLQSLSSNFSQFDEKMWSSDKDDHERYNSPDKKVTSPPTVFSQAELVSTTGSPPASSDLVDVFGGSFASPLDSNASALPQNTSTSVAVTNDFFMDSFSNLNGNPPYSQPSINQSSPQNPAGFTMSANDPFAAGNNSDFLSFQTQAQSKVTQALPQNLCNFATSESSPFAGSAAPSLPFQSQVQKAAAHDFPQKQAGFIPPETDPFLDSVSTFSTFPAQEQSTFAQTSLLNDLGFTSLDNSSFAGNDTSFSPIKTQPLLGTELVQNSLFPMTSTIAQLPTKSESPDLFGSLDTNQTSKPVGPGLNPFLSGLDTQIVDQIDDGFFQQATKSQGTEESKNLVQQSDASSLNDLDLTLASNIASLSLIGQRANLDFQPKQEKKLTGGAKYSPTRMSSPTTFTTAPMFGIGLAGFQQQPPVMMTSNIVPPTPQQYQQSGLGFPSQQSQPSPRSFSPTNPFSDFM